MAAVGVDVFVCVCASGKIEERGEKMQRRLCHVSMEINKLCRMHGTAYHTCIQVHTHREQKGGTRAARSDSVIVLSAKILPLYLI